MHIIITYCIYLEDVSQSVHICTNQLIHNSHVDDNLVLLKESYLF